MSRQCVLERDLVVRLAGPASAIARGGRDCRMAGVVHLDVKTKGQSWKCGNRPLEGLGGCRAAGTISCISMKTADET
jgi:hypothetical protein